MTVEPRRRFSAASACDTSGRVRSSKTPACKSSSTTIWNGEVGYSFSNKARLVLEVFNLFDAEVSDIDYFYTSRLPGNRWRRGRHPHASRAPADRAPRSASSILRMTRLWPIAIVIVALATRTNLAQASESGLQIEVAVPGRRLRCAEPVRRICSTSCISPTSARCRSS